MQEFKKRRGHKGELLNLGLRGFGCLVLFGVTVLAIHAAWGMYGKLAEASGGRDSAQAELSALKQQEAQVSASVAEISSPRGVEVQLRERFGVARPGEGVIQIVRESASTSAQAPAQESWWARITHALFMW